MTGADAQAGSAAAQGAPRRVLAIELGDLHARLRREGYEPIPLPATPEGFDALLPAAPGIDALVTIAMRGLPGPFLERAARLRLVAVLGAGYEAFDPHALRRRGIALVNAEGMNAPDVAELAIGLLLSVWRGIASRDAWIRAGSWTRQAGPRHRFSGTRLGIVGMGAIGRAVAVRAEAFGVEVAWFGPRPKDVGWRHEPDLLELARWADSVVVAARPTADNRNMIGDAFLNALGPRGVLVNVSRGSLVDEPALIAALREGRIAGAGLDVFAREPLDPEAWRDVPNTVLHPHAGGATQEALSDGCDAAIENLRRAFGGEPLLNLVN